MPTLLIGFQYQVDRIPVAVDLYLAYRYLRAARRSSLRIHIVTDIGPGAGLFLVRSTDLAGAAARGIVDQGVFVFCDVLQGSQPSEDPDLVIHRASDRESFEQAVETVRSLAATEGAVEGGAAGDGQDDQFFVYFTGHGERGATRLPDHSLVPIDDFMTTILRVSPGAQVFWIMDSCYLAGGRLPYCYDAAGDRMRLIGAKAAGARFRDQRVLMVTGSTEKSTTLIDNYGSQFSRRLFRVLGEMRRGDRKRNFATLASACSSDRSAPRLSSECSADCSAPRLSSECCVSVGCQLLAGGCGQCQHIYSSWPEKVALPPWVVD